MKYHAFISKMYFIKSHKCVLCCKSKEKQPCKPIPKFDQKLFKVGYIHPEPLSVFTLDQIKFFIKAFLV